MASYLWCRQAMPRLVEEDVRMLLFKLMDIIVTQRRRLAVWFRSTLRDIESCNESRAWNRDTVQDSVKIFSGQFRVCRCALPFHMARVVIRHRYSESDEIRYSKFAGAQTAEPDVRRQLFLPVSMASPKLSPKKVRQPHGQWRQKDGKERVGGHDLGFLSEFHQEG
ncbi:MAG: hypothetical protein OXE17_02905 [Chloroflexi bacterium]|nr:hypothetical protein [Chloroflexota bacterium]